MRSLDLRQVHRAILPSVTVVLLVTIFKNKQTQTFNGRKF